MTSFEKLVSLGRGRDATFPHESSIAYQKRKHEINFAGRALAAPSHPWTPGLVHAYATIKFSHSHHYFDDVTACDENMGVYEGHWVKPAEATAVTCFRCAAYLAGVG